MNTHTEEHLFYSHCSTLIDPVHFRQGSLVVEADVLFEEDIATAASSDLTSALINLSASNVTIGNQTGTVSLTIGGTTGIFVAEENQ